MKKKLVTGNARVREYDLYKPENMFILGVDDIGRLKEFFEIPYKELDKKEMEKYDFSNWVNGII